MLEPGNKLEFCFLDQQIEQQAKERADRYRKSVETLQQRLSTPVKEGATEQAPTEVQKAFAATIERENSWWVWELKAREESNPEKREHIYRQGLIQFPDSPELIGNFANFTYIRKNYDEAERLYHRALTLAPNDATILRNFATFMTRIRKNHDEAERLYRHALALDPNEAGIIGNFAALLLARGRCPEAKELACRAWALNAAQATQVAAEVSLYLALIAQTEERDDTPALGRLKTLLYVSFERAPWSFDNVLAAPVPKLSEADQRFYAALAAAILDESKVADLDGFARWKETTPIPLDAPWVEEK